MTRSRTSLAVLITSATALIGLLGTASTAGAEPAPGASDGTTTSAADGSTSPAATDSSSPTAPASSPVARKAPAAGPACSTNADAAYPVVCLPADSGEDQTGQAVIGGSIDFGAQIVNNGPDVTGAKLVITVPAQLRVSDDEGVVRYDDWYDDDSDEDGTDLTCTTSADGGTVTCETGPLASGVNALADITLEVTDAAKAGSSATFSVALQAEGEDTFPSTSVSATVAFLLPSRLKVTVTPGKADVVVGRTRSLSVTVRNIGQGEAPDTFAATVLAPTSFDGDEENPSESHFEITNAPKIDLPEEGLTSASPATRSSSVSLFRAHAGRTAARRAQTQIAVWPIGTVAPGGTAGFTVKVKALSKGTNRLLVGAFSETVVDDACDNSEGSDDPSVSDPNCPGLTVATLNAVAAPAAASSSGHAPAGAGDAVANTGVENLTPQLLTGLLALLAGAGFTYAGRRRVRGRHAG